jgi:hypothetical protein
LIERSIKRFVKRAFRAAISTLPENVLERLCDPIASDQPL